MLKIRVLNVFFLYVKGIFKHKFKVNKYTYITVNYTVVNLSWVKKLYNIYYIVLVT